MLHKHSNLRKLNILVFNVGEIIIISSDAKKRIGLEK